MTRRGTGLIVAGLMLMIVGLVAFVAGWRYGHSNVRITLAEQPIDCGSVYSPDHSAEDQANLTESFLGQPPQHPCGDAIGSRRTPTHVLVWGGGAVAVVAFAGLLVPGLVLTSGRHREDDLDDE